jgi:hypothetical protein
VTSGSALAASRMSGTTTLPSSASATSSSPWKLGYSVSSSGLRPFEPLLHCEGSIFLYKNQFQHPLGRAPTFPEI